MNISLLGHQIGSILANGEKFFDSMSKGSIQSLAGDLNLASAILNSASAYYNIVSTVTPLSLSVLSFEVNKASLATQVAALSEAILNNDSQGIAKGVVGVVGATAGIVGSIPGLPPNIAMPARALNLGCGAISLLLTDPDRWNALSDAASAFWESLSDAASATFKALDDALTDLTPLVNDLWNRARSWVRRDPLALDLNGNGLETVGATGPNVVLFDHDGDGTKTGTGWVQAGDGLLVLDKNGNGQIDNGSELFGIDTVLSNGQKAANGFAALADLDANHDGVFNAGDTTYSQVRVWQDANQDGLSQAGELKTLAALGITGINLNALAANQALAGGNTLDLTAT